MGREDLEMFDVSIKEFKLILRGHELKHSESTTTTKQNRKAARTATAPMKTEKSEKGSASASVSQSESVNGSRPPSPLTRMSRMSADLQAIIGVDGPMPRNKIIKAFWDYCERNGLKRKGRLICCDAKLKRIYGEDTQKVHLYDVQSGLSRHITIMTREEEAQHKREHPNFESEAMQIDVDEAPTEKSKRKRHKKRKK